MAIFSGYIGGKRADQFFQPAYTKRMALKPKCPKNNEEFKRNTLFTANLKGFIKKYKKNGNLKESTKNKARNEKNTLIPTDNYRNSSQIN